MSDEFIYALSFSNGVIKVGRSKNPRQRIATHVVESSRFGVSIDERWVSRPHTRSAETEAELIAWCGQHGEVFTGAEYFSGLRFAALTSAAERIVAESDSTEPPTLPVLPYGTVERDARHIGCRNGVPPRATQEGMALGLSVVAKTWDEAVAALSDRPYTKDQVRRLGESVLRVAVEAITNPDAWTDTDTLPDALIQFDRAWRQHTGEDEGLRSIPTQRGDAS